MAEEEVVVTIPAPSADLKRKLDEVEPDVLEQHAGSEKGSNRVIVDYDDSKAASDSSYAKRPKLDDEAADGSDNGKMTKENGSVQHKDANQDSVPLVKEAAVPIHEDECEANTCVVDQSAVKPEDPISHENIVEECKNHNGGETEKEVDEKSKDESSQISKENKVVDGGNSQNEVGYAQSTTRRIEVPSSKVGVLIGKGGENIRSLQFSSGAKIQILKDSEADPNSAVRPVDLIGSVACIENAEKLINAVIAEAEAGGSPALVARGHYATHATGISEQIEIKVPNDKVGLIIGRGGESIKHMQARSGARIQLIPQHAESEEFKERTVRISGDKRQIDVAKDLIKDVMYQNARQSPYSSGYNQPAYRPPRGPGGPPQWGSRGPHPPYSRPYDYRYRGPYSSQGSHYNSPGYSGYPPQHMPPRGRYGAGWDQRPPHPGPYNYYGGQGAQTSGPVPHPPGRAPSPALGGPPPSQVSYGYSQSHGPEYGHAASYSQTSHPQGYEQMYEQPKYGNTPPIQPPFGGSYPPTGGGQPGYSQMQQPGSYGTQQAPVQHGYGPPLPAAAASPGDPYQNATPAAAAALPYGNANMAPQQQYGYEPSSAPVQQQTYPSYSMAPPSDGYNNGTQTPATGPAYQHQTVQPASSAHDQPGARQAAETGSGGKAAPTSGYNSYPSLQPSYGTAQAQDSGNYAYNPSSQDPNYGYGAAPSSQPGYSQAVPTQAGYEQQAATQPASYATVPGSAQVQNQ